MTRFLPLIAFVLMIAGCKGCHEQSTETADAAAASAADAAAPTLAAPSAAPVLGKSGVPMLDKSGAPAIRSQNTAHIQRNPDGTLSIVKNGEIKRLPKRMLNPNLMLKQPVKPAPAAPTK